MLTNNTSGKQMKACKEIWNWPALLIVVVQVSSTHQDGAHPEPFNSLPFACYWNECKWDKS